ncbi:MAG: glycosyltransferase family 4 protein [Verrucomicrobiota bacterium]
MSDVRAESVVAPAGRRAAGKSLVLLGPISDDPAESVSAVNGAFVRGLADRYGFVPLVANRSVGNTRQSKINLVNASYFLRQWAQWTGCLARRRPAIAHYAISAGWAMEKGLILMKTARLFGARTVGHIHSGSFLTFWNSLPGWRRRAARREFGHLDALVLLSDSWREKIATELGLPPERLFVVNNPIDPDFETEALAMPLERSGNVLFSLGTMGRPKGVMDILQAATLLPPELGFKIQLAGPEREPGILGQVRQFITEHGLADYFDIKSSVWGEEKARLYRQASVFLLPSYFENFPLVILEAAAAGLAIVTTPVGAIPEFFQDGISALFVQPGQPAQIARALQTLIERPAERQRLGAAARQVFRTRLARSKIMDSLHLVYRQILAV